MRFGSCVGGLLTALSRAIPTHETENCCKESNEQEGPNSIRKIKVDHFLSLKNAVCTTSSPTAARKNPPDVRRMSAMDTSSMKIAATKAAVHRVLISARRLSPMTAIILNHSLFFNYCTSFEVIRKAHKPHSGQCAPNGLNKKRTALKVKPQNFNMSERYCHLSSKYVRATAIERRIKPPINGSVEP